MEELFKLLLLASTLEEPSDGDRYDSGVLQEFISIARELFVEYLKFIENHLKNYKINDRIINLETVNIFDEIEEKFLIYILQKIRTEKCCILNRNYGTHN